MRPLPTEGFLSILLCQDLGEKSFTVQLCLRNCFIMIVLGWMLFVGFACYMGTFPEFMVSNDSACKFLVVNPGSD